MDFFWYYAALLLAKLLRALPLGLVARLGQMGGVVAYFVDGRHRRVAMLNFRRCFPEQDTRQRRATVRQHFRRLGENYASAVKTSGMSDESISAHLEITGAEKLAKHRGAIIAVGHFANFELYARVGTAMPHAQVAATYRGLKQPLLDKLVRELRLQSGCLYFDRTQHGEALRQSLTRGGVMLGLLSDQHRSGGPRVEFLGHSCLTTAAPAVLAQRYNLPLFTAVCYRVALAQWRIEFGEEIPTRVDSARRPVADIMRDVNAAFEIAVRRDPANWFWVHDRWRFDKERRRKIASQSTHA
jgi:lauroyl/myristoyl acyltransferase